MATFNYETYMAQQQNRPSQTSGTSEGRVEIHFLNEYLKNDGDSVIIRFPYTGMHELMYSTTHLMPFPGRQYPGRVHCEAENCPLCASGIKQDIRVFLKALAYIPSAGNVIEIKNAIWDRPAAFADIDLKNFIVDYGDISGILFKLRRNGKGTATRYSLTPIVNSAIYSPEIYKADFTELNKINPGSVLAKTVDQYNKIIGNGSAHAVAASVPYANSTAVSEHLAASNANTTQPQPFAMPANPNIDQVTYAAPVAPPANMGVAAPDVVTQQPFVAPVTAESSVNTGATPTFTPQMPAQPQSAAVNPNAREPKRYVF